LKQFMSYFYRVYYTGDHFTAKESAISTYMTGFFDLDGAAYDSLHDLLDLVRQADTKAENYNETL
jgi:hypothetical protein